MIATMANLLDRDGEVSVEIKREGDGYRAIVQFHGAVATQDLSEEAQALRQKVAMPLVVRASTPEALETALADLADPFAQTNRDMRDTVNDLMADAREARKTAQAAESKKAPEKGGKKETTPQASGTDTTTAPNDTTEEPTADADNPLGL
ncbi:hypothetical protein [Thioalkalivibrio sp. ALE23]|uniref:hypothetical protein n=1 Tax=Thioalkalivibrio sp. ALE23 TaxID=1265495 RepID=UPI00057038EF|nr:hypothetical protein [Thioalkalivibrio sp. ALE23]